MDSILNDINYGIGVAGRIELIGKIKGSGDRVYRYTTATGDKVKVYPSSVEIGDKKIKNKEVYSLLNREYTKDHSKSEDIF